MCEFTQEQIMQNWSVKDTENPLVSVRCITYNHEPYIAQAIDGFLMQKTDFPFEVIIHDDASTDKTADIIREYEKKYPLIIKPIYQTENQYSKRNGSIAKAIDPKLKGKYIAFCEGDDYWIDPNKLQMQVAFLEKNPEFSAYYCNVKVIDEFGNDISKTIRRWSERRTTIFKRKLRRFELIGQLSGLVCKNYYTNLSAEHYNIYLNTKCNGDVKLCFLLNGLGKVYFFEKKMSVYRRTYNTDSWNSRNKGRNLYLMVEYCQENIAKMVYSIWGYNLDILYVQCSILINALRLYLYNPTTKNRNIFFILLKKKRKNIYFFYYLFFLYPILHLFRKISLL